MGPILLRAVSEVRASERNTCSTANKSSLEIGVVPVRPVFVEKVVYETVRMFYRGPMPDIYKLRHQKTRHRPTHLNICV